MQTAGPLVIFDCDGVLVDSETVSIRVLLDGLRSKGLEMDEAEAYRHFLGRSLGTVTRTIREEFGIDADESFLEGMRQELYARFRAELKPMPGIAETLDALSFRRCVASSSQPERIRLSLSITGLIGRLEPNIFSAAMVARGKPAPDLFLHAASQMGADPQNCIVIEDSPAGIEAGHRAGMAVFAFVGGSHAGTPGYRERIDALSPEVVFDAMPDLIHLVQKHIEDRGGSAFW
ncbi:HAD family hydrolase [Neorhizobium sp. Rsf11]|uniref:HAD family hydrolase n=2 Tax=Neorhizobium TaxID=1525371 RepID=A0ABV0MBR1_9HYPH|nr:HAD family hydrolase [Neorhizobium petrolearium]MCC2611586.1 HAD family hydrolase [Neorhizobium petrolearium]WGI71246.1 HAD family hydrolase [Neorhizobium petrolearium]